MAFLSAGDRYFRFEGLWSSYTTFKGSNRPNLTVGSYDESALGICLYLSIYHSLCLTHSLSLPSETRRPLVVRKVNGEIALDSLSYRDFVAGAYSQVMAIATFNLP